MHRLVPVTVALVAVCVRPAAAEIVEIELVGEVTSVDTTLWTGFEHLAATGVVVGAQANATVSFDGEASGEPLFGIFTQYADAVVGIDLQIGSYALTFDPGGKASNGVRVRDGEPGTTPDTWTLFGPVTNGVSANDPAALLTSSASFSFSDADGDASDGDAIVQDPDLYFDATGTLAGDLGIVRIAWTTGAPTPTTPPHGGVGGAFDENTSCRKAQIAAAAKSGKRLLALLARDVKRPPQADPDDAALEAGVDKAATAFLAKLDALSAKHSCSLGHATHGEAVAAVSDDLRALALELTTSVDPASAPDRALRGKLVKALAHAWSREMRAYGKRNVPGPLASFSKIPIEATGALIEKAEQTLVARVLAALTKAEAKGVAYDGPTGPDVAEQLLPIVEAFELDTHGIVLDD